ncbi:glycosyl hydrolase family 61-domain-containing protein [Biscogniauxia marginata]|nr:glycosyl hydrolase family 61-domain-containing protein [Biscogniauxia marginata]
MKSLSLLVLAAPFLGVARAHTLFTTLYINEVKQGDGTCTPVAYTCPAPAGAKLTFEYRVSPDKGGSGFIDPSHKGPVAVYAKQLSSPDDTAAGPGWFKLWGEGYDAAADKWATEKFMATNGLISINIPAALPAGNWLFRPEVVALHNVTPAVEPQFYVGCAQVFVKSDVAGTLGVPADRSVSIPGHLRAGDAGMTYNIYEDEEYADPKVPYPGLGPKAFVPDTSSSSSSSSSTNTNGAVVVVASQPAGGVGIPDSCLLVNANWCGVEVPPYADADARGCWAAVDDCWAQADACWDAAPASGGRNCAVWGTKCEDLDERCAAGEHGGGGPPAFELTNSDWPAPGPIPDAVNAADVPAAQEAETETSGSSAVAEDTYPATASLSGSSIAEATSTAAVASVTATEVPRTTRLPCRGAHKRRHNKEY